MEGAKMQQFFSVLFVYSSVAIVVATVIMDGLIPLPNFTHAIGSDPKLGVLLKPRRPARA